MRASIQETLMKSAFLWAERSTCLKRKVGCVIARDTRIISTGYVGSPPGEPHCLDEGCIPHPETSACIRTTHAEVNAVEFAHRTFTLLKGCTIYTTLSPCMNCAEVIESAGISEVIFYERWKNSEPLEFLEFSGVNIVSYKDNYGTW